MGLTPLVFMRYRYLRSGPVNVIAMDWEALSSGPCYIAAVSNSRPAGVCVAQLVSRLRDAGATNIHIIGFSLGAHVPNFAAVKLRPYKLSRITGKGRKIINNLNLIGFTKISLVLLYLSLSKFFTTFTTSFFFKYALKIFFLNIYFKNLMIISLFF